jgi:hypothetical protein
MSASSRSNFASNFASRSCCRWPPTLSRSTFVSVVARWRVVPQVDADRGSGSAHGSGPIERLFAPYRRGETGMTAP